MKLKPCLPTFTLPDYVTCDKQECGNCIVLGGVTVPYIQSFTCLAEARASKLLHII